MNPNNIYFILDHPKTGENVGLAARTLANFGFRNLRLVAPKDMEKARRVARGGEALLKKAAVFDTLDAALADLSLVIGTSGLKLLYNMEVSTPEQACAEAVAFSARGKVGLLFGCEIHGLSVDQLHLCERVSRIPTDIGCPSMNLSHALTVYAWELQSSKGSQEASSEGAPATQREKRLVHQKLDNLLEKMDFKPEGRRHRMVVRLKHFLNRQPMSRFDSMNLMRLINFLEVRFTGKVSKVKK
jgi:tRNA/rRNA methyltransferase